MNDNSFLVIESCPHTLDLMGSTIIVLRAICSYLVWICCNFFKFCNVVRTGVMSNMIIFVACSFGGKLFINENNEPSYDGGTTIALMVRMLSIFDESVPKI